ncbi:DUF5302 domain-containing protein [Mariniluteicoccus flavus]
MSKDTNEKPGDEAVDPKEQMRLALERKNQSQHHNTGEGRAAGGKVGGDAHGPAAGKRQFMRRKSGG